MSITPQEKELVTIGIAVACGCKTCLRGDMIAARQLHVTDKDIADAARIAIDIRRSATNDVEQFVLSALARTPTPERSQVQHEDQRTGALVCIGAAFAVNHAPSLKQHVAAAEAIGIETEDIHEVVRLAAHMKTVSASQVEQAMCPDEFDDETDTLTEYVTPFGPEHCAWSTLCRAME